MKYSCLIIDDEPIAIRVVRNHLQNFANIEIAGECANALEALEFLGQHPVDLIFLDIQMPQLTGLELIQSLNHPPFIIFTTAYREFAVEAFDHDVVDYLLKPFSLARFAKAIGKFYQQVSEKNQSINQAGSDSAHEYILLKADKKIYKIDLDDLVYMESLGDYVNVYTRNDKITTKERISKLVEKLPAHKFMRIHRSYIVSIQCIDAILAGCIEIGKQKLPIGRNYKQEVETFLNK
ncbi:MAG TPA: response regulator [Prolixibacteraceae bacterium]|nr:response regulator [Prolixibacteraceae bacterium]